MRSDGDTIGQQDAPLVERLSPPLTSILNKATTIAMK